MSARDLAIADDVVGILTDWRDWMKGYSSRTGYPKRSAGFQSGYVSSTFEDMCDEADAHRNRVVDTCIDDLPPNQNAAIYRCYLSAVYRLRDYEGSLTLAHESLLIMFRKKGLMC